MSTFKASNGVEVTLQDDGGLRFSAVEDDAQRTEAAREYFQHERDQELGRWRDPENPDMVFWRQEYSDDADGRCIAAFHERAKKSEWFWEFDLVDEHPEAVRRYFEAHPEKKPWHDAQEEEVWAITIRGEERLYRCGAGGLYSIEHGARLSDTAPQHVTAGRRIWPEEGDEQ